MILMGSGIIGLVGAGFIRVEARHRHPGYPGAVHPTGDANITMTSLLSTTVGKIVPMTPSRKLQPVTRHGSTLLEVLVSIVIFAIGLLALMAGSLIAARAMIDSKSFAAAAVAGQNTVDSLRAVGWENIADASGSYTVKGHAVTWAVSGVDPRRVIVTVTRRTSPSVVNDVMEAYISHADVAR